MHVIRRADGDEMGEFAFFATDGPDGWDVAENTDHDEDTVYEILACYPVARRKMLCSTLCPTCDGEGEDGIGTMCPSCGGSGEHEAPDAERLTIHAYADAQPAHPAPDGEPGSLHLGAEDRFHLWAHINTIHQETEAASFGQSWPIARDHIHEEAACALAYFDPAPPGG